VCESAAKGTAATSTELQFTTSKAPQFSIFYIPNVGEVISKRNFFYFQHFQCGNGDDGSWKQHKTQRHNKQQHAAHTQTPACSLSVVIQLLDSSSSSIVSMDHIFLTT